MGMFGKGKGAVEEATSRVEKFAELGLSLSSGNVPIIRAHYMQELLQNQSLSGLCMLKCAVDMQIESGNANAIQVQNLREADSILQQEITRMSHGAIKDGVAGRAAIGALACAGAFGILEATQTAPCKVLDGVEKGGPNLEIGR